MYKSLLRPLFFRFDSETIHHIAVSGMRCAGVPPFRGLVSSTCGVRDPALECGAFGLQFFNPLGLAAGFDKHVQIAPFLGAASFGHVEVGTVTPKPQGGNPRPRIFRLIQDEALINRMGFPSSGVKRAEEALRKLALQSLPIHVAVNIGKNKDTELSKAAEDYAVLSEKLSPYASWLTVNVSSPNTPGLRDLQTKEALSDIVDAVRENLKRPIPVLVKLAPDLSSEQLNQLVETLVELKIDGIVSSNTTTSREGIREKSEETGGLSGRPLFRRTRATVQRITEVSEGTLPIIGVGGVTTWQELCLLMIDGATLVQGYTAFVYEGPLWPASILRSVVQFIKSQGLSSVGQLRGRSDLEALLSK